MTVARKPILASSFTKTISPETECGYMIVPNQYVGHLSDIIANTRINPNLSTQAFIADFIESGRFDDFVKYLCKMYRPGMEALNSALNSTSQGRFPFPSVAVFSPPSPLKIFREIKKLPSLHPRRKPV